MGKIIDYKDLVAWQKGRQLVREVYRLTQSLPKEEMYAMSSQIHRSAISIPSNIAEGYGRNSLQDYIRFLRVARGSCYELETQLILCEDLGYFSQKDALQVNALLHETQKLLIALLRSLEARG
ncbi:MAG: four helix bundle protein [Oscillospiraceae bacterium]|nr:four helix bundle protein [Oscillospiraceae bacterium]